MRVTLTCPEMAVPDHALAGVPECEGALSGHQGGKVADVLDRSAAWVEDVGEKARWAEAVRWAGSAVLVL
jgi:hypothetical protein